MSDQLMQTNKCSKVAQVLAISARELAAMLSVSLRQVWRLSAAGRLPRSIRLGGSIRWNRQEIVDRFGSGCPNRRAWEARKEVAR